MLFVRALAVRQTGSGNVLPAPVDLRTRTLSTNSVRLHWVDPSLDRTQRIVDERYYNVYYHASPHGKNLSVIVKALHVTLHDLQPGIDPAKYPRMYSVYQGWKKLVFRFEIF